jgi:hypothetical protein
MLAHPLKRKLVYQAVAQQWMSPLASGVMLHYFHNKILFYVTFLLSPVNLAPPYMKSAYCLANLSNIVILKYNTPLSNFSLLT